MAGTEPPLSPREPAGRAGSRLFTAAVLLAASAVLSRVLGYGREAVMSRLLGVGVEVDAYRAAFLLPDMMNYFLAGGAVSVAFIPLYTRTLARGGRDEADALLAKVLGTTAWIVAGVTCVLWLAADSLLAGIYAEFPPEQLTITVRLTRIVLPAQFCFIVGGVIKGALMAHGRFTAQALAPLLYNAGIIAGGLLGGAQLGAEGFAWGALAGAVAGPLVVAWIEAARAPELRLGLRFAPFDPGFLRYVVLALPVMLGLSLLTVDEWYDRYFGQFVGAGAIAALGYARLLLQLPVGVIGQALATAALPFLARLWSEGRRDELDAALLETLRAGLALAVLAAAGYLALAEPIVALLYQGGRFSAADTAAVAGLLRIFAFAVPAWVTQQIAVRAFYAREDMWRPMALGTAIALAATALYWRLGRDHGAPGLAAAGAIAMSINAVATLVLARVLHGGPKLAALALSALRAVLVAAPAAGAAAALPPTGIEGLAGRAADLALAGVAFALVAVPAALLVGDAPLRAALRRLLGRRP